MDPTSARLLLVREQLAQLALRQDLLASQLAAVAAHRLAIDGKTFAPRLVQQHSIDQCPSQAVAVRPPSPGEPEKMLHVLSVRHRDGPLLVKVADTHRELQRKGFREAPRRARHRGLVAYRRPAVGQGLRVILSSSLLRGGVAHGLSHGAPGTITEKARCGDDLLEHAILQIFALDVLVRAVGERKRAGAQQLADKKANRELAASEALQLLVQRGGSLLRVLLPEHLVRRLVCRRSQTDPPARRLAAEHELGALQPANENSLLDFKVGVLSAGGVRNLLVAPLSAEEAHVEPAREQLLARPGIRQGSAVGHHGARAHDLLPRKQIESTRVVPLVHGLVGTAVQAPAPKLRQRLQDVRHQAPTELEAFEHATAPEVPAQH